MIDHFGIRKELAQHLPPACEIGPILGSLSHCRYCGIASKYDLHQRLRARIQSGRGLCLIGGKLRGEWGEKQRG